MLISSKFLKSSNQIINFISSSVSVGSRTLRIVRDYIVI